MSDTPHFHQLRETAADSLPTRKIELDVDDKASGLRYSPVRYKDESGVYKA
jgi:hypothetical protein